jgi:hypothetical protein
MVTKTRSAMPMTPFAEVLKTLPSVAGLERLDLTDPAGAVVATIENKPGQAGSLAVYNHLLLAHGRIDAEAARAGLALYAEHGEDARRNPGKHPNIDRLLAIEAGGTPLGGRLVPKTRT